ncbi:hypothetical protein PGB90_005519 [Kerria lacca]
MQVSSSLQRTCTLYPLISDPRNFASVFLSNSSLLPFLLTLLLESRMPQIMSYHSGSPLY